MKAFFKREESNFEKITYQAWQTANLTRAEKLPSFKELMNKTKKSEPQTAEQMFALAQLMNAALGGD